MRLLAPFPATGLLVSMVTAARFYQGSATLNALIKSDDCDNSDLPDDFHILNFVGHSADKTGKSLDSFEFSYLEDSNNVSTKCHFNSTSKNLASTGRAPKYACETKRVQFIWQDDILSIIEGVCPEPDGSAPYEASGGAQVFLECEAVSSCGTQDFTCAANTTDIKGDFSSGKPTKAGTVNVGGSA